MKLTIFKRDLIGKHVKELRKQNKIPGIVYGKYLTENLPIYFDKNIFLKTYKEVGGSKPIDIEGDGIKQLALIYDIAQHPVTDEVIHVDFFAVKADEKIEADVVLKLDGESLVEKNSLGRIELLMDHIRVEAYPKDLPSEIRIDKSKIQNLNDVIFVKDIDLGTKILIKTKADLPIITAVEIKEEIEINTSATVSASGEPITTETKDEKATEEKKDEKKK